MNVKNTPFNVDATRPVNPDQIQACWRYLLSGAGKIDRWATQAAQYGYTIKSTAELPLTLVNIVYIASTAYSALATAVHKDEADSLINFQNGVDYEQWHQNYPGFNLESSVEYINFKNNFPHLFEKQLHWECSRWNLNEKIMRGCLLGWAIEQASMTDGLAITYMKSFLKTNAPIYLSKVQNTQVTDVAVVARIGKGKRSYSKSAGFSKPSARGGFRKKKYYKKRKF